MIGLGTLINTAAIAAGGLAGGLFGRLLGERTQTSLTSACGVSVLFIAIAGAMEKMLSLGEQGLLSGGSMLVVISLALGTLAGEMLGIEDGFERFGEWLKRRTGNSETKGFTDAFVTASLTVCIGAMAIVGSIRDGMTGDWSVLAVKSVLDFVIILVMSASMGKGCGFSAVPVFILEGGVTLAARLLAPVMSQGALDNISLTGSVLIFCVGVNLIWEKRFRVANMLPSLVFAALFAYVPWSFLS